MRIDARCWPTTFTLDALGRTVGRQYIDGTRATFTFDAAGEQTTMQDVTGVTTYLRDNAVRQIGVVNGAGKALTFTLDLVGNRMGLVDSDANWPRTAGMPSKQRVLRSEPAVGSRDCRAFEETWAPRLRGPVPAAIGLSPYLREPQRITAPLM